MNTNKIRKEITFNTKEEHTIYHDFKKRSGVNWKQFKDYS